jgi:prepilin-type N-terminal cleavage/methylation domain-containing protein
MKASAKPGRRQTRLRRQAVRGRAGFTLLEIAIVLFIMGLMITLVMPHIGGIQTARLKSQARRLAGRATYLYAHASSDKVVLRLTFDLDTNSYSVARLDPYAVQPIFMPDSEPGFAPVMMPIGVRLRDVTVEGIGTASRGTVSAFFYPEGYVDATVIHLADDSGNVFTLGLNPMTGRVSITNGDVSPSVALGQL